MISKISSLNKLCQHSTAVLHVLAFPFTPGKCVIILWGSLRIFGRGGFWFHLVYLSFPKKNVPALSSSSSVSPSCSVSESPSRSATSS